MEGWGGRVKEMLGERRDGEEAMEMGGQVGRERVREVPVCSSLLC